MNSYPVLLSPGGFYWYFDAISLKAVVVELRRSATSTGRPVVLFTGDARKHSLEDLDGELVSPMHRR